MAFNGSIQTLYGIENVVFLVFFLTALKAAALA